jgi:hypothetical protein
VKVHVAVFLEFRFDHVASFDDEASAKAYAHGIARGYRLASGQGAIYVPILPWDSAELADIITDPATLAELNEALA